MRHISFGIRRISLPLALVVVFALASSSPASATVINFDALGCGATGSTFGGGFTFSDSWVIECDSDYQTTWGNSPANSAPSPPNAGSNSYAPDAGTVSITRAQPFNLASGMASSFLVGDAFDFTTPMSSASLLINGYLGNAFVGSIYTQFTSPGYISLVGSLLNVNRLEFFSSFEQGETGGFDYWLVDDLNLTDAETVVPEPLSLVLLGTGLTVLTMRRRSRRNKV